MASKTETGASGVPSASLPASLMLVGAITAFQTGSALATHLFVRVGPAAATFMRTTAAAVILILMTRRGIRHARRHDIALLFVFGLVIAGMSVTFYEAISRLPLGVVVTIEFAGPLSVAVVGSRRLLDVLVALAATAGVALLAGPRLGVPTDRVGLLLAATCAALWATYILIAKRVTRVFSPLVGVGWALGVAAVVLAPVGLTGGGSRIVHGSTLLLAVAVGVLSAAVPFVLEFAALRRLRAATYGILVSLEPAMATLTGWLLLGQHLRGAQLAGIALVVCASASVAVTSRTDATPPPP